MYIWAEKREDRKNPHNNNNVANSRARSAYAKGPYNKIKTAAHFYSGSNHIINNNLCSMSGRAGCLLGISMRIVYCCWQRCCSLSLSLLFSFLINNTLQCVMFGFCIPHYDTYLYSPYEYNAAVHTSTMHYSHLHWPL